MQLTEHVSRGPAAVRPPKVLLVFPTFNPHTFWSFKETCELVGARYPAPPLGLITLAAASVRVQELVGPLPQKGDRRLGIGRLRDVVRRLGRPHRGE